MAPALALPAAIEEARRAAIVRPMTLKALAFAKARRGMKQAAADLKTARRYGLEISAAFCMEDLQAAAAAFEKAAADLDAKTRAAFYAAQDSDFRAAYLAPPRRRFLFL